MVEFEQDVGHGFSNVHAHWAMQCGGSDLRDSTLGCKGTVHMVWVSHSINP